MNWVLLRNGLLCCLCSSIFSHLKFWIECKGSSTCSQFVTHDEGHFDLISSWITTMYPLESSLKSICPLNHPSLPSRITPSLHLSSLIFPFPQYIFLLTLSSLYPLESPLYSLYIFEFPLSSLYPLKPLLSSSCRLGNRFLVIEYGKPWLTQWSDLLFNAQLLRGLRRG